MHSSKQNTLSMLAPVCSSTALIGVFESSATSKSASLVARRQHDEIPMVDSHNAGLRSLLNSKQIEAN